MLTASRERLTSQAQVQWARLKFLGSSKVGGQVVEGKQEQEGKMTLECWREVTGPINTTLKIAKNKKGGRTCWESFQKVAGNAALDLRGVRSAARSSGIIGVS